MSTDPRQSGRQWRVFHGFIRWTLVLLMALLPPCLVAVLELPLTLSATVLLLVATLVSAWSLDQVTDCWTRTALPEIRGPWGLPRVGIIRGRPLTLLPTLLPILVAVPLAVASTGGRRLLLACVCMALVVAIPRISWWGSRSPSPCRRGRSCWVSSAASAPPCG
jgi:hypothetical protein